MGLSERFSTETVDIGNSDLSDCGSLGFLSYFQSQTGEVTVLVGPARALWHSRSMRAAKGRR